MRSAVDNLTGHMSLFLVRQQDVKNVVDIPQADLVY